MPRRLDIYLADEKIAPSRTAAANMIKEGKITVNSFTVTKPSYAVCDGDSVVLVGEPPKYVGRGGIKLEGAVEHYGIDLKGKICLDIGASTGGFTDCMLKHGAALVYAVDVGSGQLSEKLFTDSRVISMEKTDIRTVGDKVPKVDFISVDVSFISLKLILPSVYEHLKDNAFALALIKPQFEAGKAHIGKNGIVKDSAVHRAVCDDISAFAQSVGFYPHEITRSAITGGDGNVEFFICLEKRVGAANQ